MQINDYLTIENYDEAINRKIDYIVIHYVGAEGGAKANCAYFYSKNRNASAHYFVGHEGEIWRCVLDKNIAWHCGASTYYNDCRNANSIGIELCTRYINGKWVFNDKTVAAAIELTKELMKKYNIPLERVVRHYDVTRKQCPAPFVLNNTKHTWEDFKKALEEPKEEPKKETVQATFKEGDKVTVKKGAKWYDGEEPHSWVYNATFYIRELVRDRAVISIYKTGAITGAINIKYLNGTN